MVNFAATLELLRPEEIPDALYLVDVLERAGHIDTVVRQRIEQPLPSSTAPSPRC
jgi:hypothetical protein